MIAGSMFSGVGGMDLGLQRAGFDHAYFAEVDPWRRCVLGAHWKDVPIFDDVRLLGRYGNRVESVDLLSGGFPCQDLSHSGSREGLAGQRSGLFREFARMAGRARPRWILLENVPGLLSSNDGRDMGVLAGTLADLGYDLAWRVLDARYFGVPQRRRRVFIAGHLGGEPGSALHALCESCPASPPECPCSWQEPAGRAQVGTRVDRFYYVEDHVNGTLRANGGNLKPRVDRQPLVVGALTSTNGDLDDQDTRRMVVEGSLVRRLTPLECERLMSWPDNWTDPGPFTSVDYRRYAACGDGVVANVAEWIGRRIRSVDDG